MTLLIDRSDFLSTARLDPEVRAEHRAERRREAARRDAWLGERRALAGVGDVVPERFEEVSDDELLARAEAAVARRLAFRRSAEGRFLSALGEIDAVVGQALAALEQARAARARGFTGERDLCRRKADELFDLARRFRSAALDASLATDAV
jgi:hypothetical protein